MVEVQTMAESVVAVVIVVRAGGRLDVLSALGL